jgi:hypothetical protein
MDMIIHQTKNKNSLLFAVGSLTVKHMIVDIAITKIPVAAERLFACTGCVSSPRHCDAPRASKAPRGSMARLRGQWVYRMDSEDFKSAVPPKVPTRAYADWYRRVSKKERMP